MARKKAEPEEVTTPARKEKDTERALFAQGGFRVAGEIDVLIDPTARHARSFLTAATVFSVMPVIKIHLNSITNDHNPPNNFPRAMNFTVTVFMNPPVPANQLAARLMASGDPQNQPLDDTHDLNPIAGPVINGRQATFTFHIPNQHPAGVNSQGRKYVLHVAIVMDGLGAGTDSWPSRPVA
jgi:hypothetical protein